MSTDRTQYKQVVVGSLGSNRTVANAANVVAQDAQRFFNADIGAVTATTATANYTLPVARTDTAYGGRQLIVRECRILPGGPLAGNATNYQTISYGYTNDNSANFVLLGTINTTPTANAGTGTWALGTSIVVPATLNTSQAVPAGSQLQVIANFVGAGAVIPAGTRFQLIVEEV